MDGEPPHGAFMRLAARNGARSPGHLAKTLGISMRAVMAGHHQTQIEIWAGLPKGSLARFYVQASANTRIVCLAGQKIALGDWSTNQRRICMACLTGDRSVAAAQGLPADAVIHTRAIWDVRSIITCPVHDSSLTDRCPKCKRVLSWSDPAVGKCGGGCDLDAESQVVITDPLSRYLAARLGFGEAPGEPHLDHLEYRHVVRFCELLGLAKVRCWSPYLERRTRADTVSARRTGFSNLGDFDRNFWAMLDAILASRPCVAQPKGMIAAYGWVYNYWASHGGPIAGPIRRRLREHAAANGIIATDEPLFGLKTPPTVTIKQLRAALGSGYNSTRRELIGAGLRPQGTRRGVSSAIPMQAIGVIRNARLQLPLGTRAVGKKLGVGRGCARDLIALKLIGRCAGGCAPEEVDRFETRLTERCGSDGHVLAIPVTQAARSRNIRIAYVLEAILAGRLRAWLSPDGPSLPIAARLLVVPPEIAVEPKSSVPIAKAAKLLKLHPEAVSQLVMRGCIARVDGRGVCVQSVAAFLRTFMPLAPVARQRRTSSRDLARQLAKNDVYPAFEPPSYRQLVYERAKLIDIFGQQA